MTDWTDEYRERVREFMVKHGSKVEVNDQRYSWQDEDDDAGPYGWNDHTAYEHTRSAEGKYPGDGCHWVVPEGAKLYERTYSMFVDTFSGNKHEVGVNVKGCRCACGKYEDVILRWDGSVSEMLHEILGLPNARVEIEL